MSVIASLSSGKILRNLSEASEKVNNSFTRLSSGLRINKASDDAAGLAIAARLNADTRIFTQGVRNLNDGLSAVNIAESAMDSLGNIISRIEELSVQSANGTYNDTQRGALQQEATALTAEWNRIVESTSFNGKYILTGSNARTVLQGGKSTEGTLAVQIGEAQLAGGLEGYGGRGTVLVTTGSTGTQGDAISSVNAMSADGRYIVFNSDAANLVAGDLNLVRDAFVKDTVTGALTRISTNSAGTEGDDESNVNAISADGRYVAFWSYATNLVTGDVNGERDTFLKDTVTGTTTLISTDSAGNQGDSGSLASGISADGRYVLFHSFATNLVADDNNTKVDSFIRDTVTNITTRITTDSSGNEGDENSHATAISADGRYAAFYSDATNLVAGDSNGVTDAFIKDTKTGITTRVSTDSSGNQANGASNIRSISADGRYAAFYSDATNLVTGDTNGATDASIKDTITGVTTRISTDSSGNQANGASYVRAISADGRYVTFDSDGTNLVTGDTNGVTDSFIKDTVTGLTTRISVDSAGNQGNGASAVTSISADARKVAFNSLSTNLVSGDINTFGDGFLRDLTKTGVQTLSGVVISNQASAKVTLDLVQRYRNELSDYRSKIGASTSRISTFVNALQSTTMNYKAASSSITDIDIAEEVTKSIASKIKQEVATSILAQANQRPQMTLALLRNI